MFEELDGGVHVFHFRCGFNSHGHNIVGKRLAPWSTKRHEFPGKQLGVSLGKNKDSPQAVDDYVRGVRALGEFADYLVINVSSPNTPGLRDLQAREQLNSLLNAVSAAVHTHTHTQNAYFQHSFPSPSLQGDCREKFAPS